MAKDPAYKIEQGQEKDSPIRSILKAISWRLIASGTTYIVTYVIFSRFSQQSMDQAAETAGYITSIDMVAKLVFYYAHERLWTNIRWGKYWSMEYWRRRSWKRLYNRMHK